MVASAAYEKIYSRLGFVCAIPPNFLYTTAALCSTEAQTGSSSSLRHFLYQGQSSLNIGLNHLPAHQPASDERRRIELQKRRKLVQC